jgi:CubicO group peptidase (beta-lactamase class C family)
MYEKTKALIVKLMKEKTFSGVSFSFITQDQTEAYCWGQAQTYPTPELLTPEMLFDVASLTKVVGTTTVILKLMEQGRLNIDRPLQDYLSDFSDGRITLRHLLTHTADIQSYIKHRDQLNATELRQAYLQLAAGDQLGKKVAYTDTGTILLGFLLEKLYQKDVTAVLKEEVLMPLEMWDSRFLPAAPARCVPTENHPTRGLIRGQTHDPKAFILKSHAGNAGLFTNIHDLSKFVRMYLNRGSYLGKPFLKEATVESLLQDQTPLENGKRSLGWDLLYSLDDHKPMLYHTGYTGTFIIIDVLEAEAFIFLSNRVHPTDLRDAYLPKRDQLIHQYLKEKSFSINEMSRL